MKLSELFGLLQVALKDAQSVAHPSSENQTVLTESSFGFIMSLSSDSKELYGALGEAEVDLPVAMNVCLKRR